MLNHLFDTIGSRPLGLARMIVGGAALIRSFIAWPLLITLTDPQMMRAPYAPWLPDPTIGLVIVVLAVWVVSAILFAVGWRVAVTGPLLLVSIVATLALDEQTYSNHLYLMAWLVLLLTLARSGAGLNIGKLDRSVVRWPVLLLMLQLSIVYGFSALTKLNETFLSGRVLASTLGEGFLPLPEALRMPAFLSVVAAAAVVVEMFVALFIWRTRFRPAAFLLGLGLHAAITVLMAFPLELLVFSLLMLALYPLFLDPRPLLLVWDDSCEFCQNWVRRFQRLDALRALDVVGSSSERNPIEREAIAETIHLIHHGRTTRGFAAVSRTLEHLVPTLWFAPILRLPGVSHLGERWYRRQALRRNCRLVDGSELSRDSKGR